MTTDFASKYGFALADSDSEEDASASAAMISKTAIDPMAEAQKQPTTTTASALFEGKPDEPDTNASVTTTMTTAQMMFSDTTSPVKTTLGQAAIPVSTGITSAAHIPALVQPPKVNVTIQRPAAASNAEVKAAPATNTGAAGRINTLLKGLLSDSDSDSDADDFLAKYRAQK